ncbi:flagellar motor protein MotB [Falsiroseomonas selenitidurans]
MAEEEHGHHGGAWKIAYADFVTAMMAFFLLMWLVNATTETQRSGIADYFAQPNILARGPSGSGQPFGGSSLNSAGQLVADQPMVPQLRQAPPGPDADEEQEEQAPAEPARPRFRRAPPSPPGEVDEAQQQAEAARRQELAQAAEQIRQAIRSDAALAELGRQLMVEEVPEGLRIQLVDAEGRPVFQTGQAAPNERGRALLARVAGVLAGLPHPVEITGHTDASPFRGGGDRSNWDLSAERANATRRLLVEGGVAERRMVGVSGRADRDLLVPGNPLDAGNRRVAVLMLIPVPGGSAP